jgi:hypothetical protein
MNRQDLRRLQLYRGAPLLSIIAKTHRHSPENQQDPILMGNLVKEAVERLSHHVGGATLRQWEQWVNEEVAKIDWQHTQDGLVLFVGEGVREHHKVPFAVDSRVVVDDTFATRDLVRALNRAQRYLVLVLSEKPTRLYHAFRDQLEEITTGGFPMEHNAQGGSAPLPGGRGVNASAIRDARHRQFFRTVDDALTNLEMEDPLPIVVVGVDRYQAFFREVSRHRDRICGSVIGSHDSTTAPELAKLAWPQVRQWLNDERVRVIEDLDAAAGSARLADTLDDVWRAAHEGRVRTLVVEDNYKQPGVLRDEEGLTLEPVDAVTDEPNHIDDAIDDVIETVLLFGGDVTFVPDGSLDNYKRVAAILRY